MALSRALATLPAAPLLLLALSATASTTLRLISPSGLFDEVVHPVFIGDPLEVFRVDPRQLMRSNVSRFRPTERSARPAVYLPKRF